MKLLLLITILMVSLSAQAQSLLKMTKGKAFNPSIGLNALTLYQNGSRHEERDGFAIQEIEMQFTSDVDAYFRAEATISLHQDHHEEEEGEEEDEHGSHSYIIDPEEIFIETLSIPNFTVKAGKFYVNFGKYNPFHSHALPFIYRGQVQEEMFGHEGLRQTGLSLSFLAPLPWFSEVSLQAVQPDSEILFADAHHSLVYVMRVKNLWDLTDAMTLEFGLSGLSFSSHGHDSTEEEKTNLYGSDLTIKWRPTRDGRNSSFIWSTEFIRKDRTGDDYVKNGGITSFFRYQLSQRWYAQAQYEFLGLGKSAGIQDTNAYTAQLAFIPSEFSSIRAQYDSVHGRNAEKKFSLQLNISIGAHPAHIY